MDAEGAMDQYFVGVLQLLSPCEIATVVGGQTDGSPRDCGLRDYDVYLSWGEPSDEELAQFLNEKYFKFLFLTEDHPLAPRIFSCHALCRGLHYACAR